MILVTLRGGKAKVISIEIAKKLKDAGLEWEQHELDFYYWPYRDDLCQLMCFEIALFYCDEDEAYRTTKEHGIYMPRLDQLLIEIEGRERWEYALISHTMPNKTKRYECTVTKYADGFTVEFNSSYADSPDEAAAQALLWIIEQ